MKELPALLSQEFCCRCLLLIAAVVAVVVVVPRLFYIAADIAATAWHLSSRFNSCTFFLFVANITRA